MAWFSDFRAFLNSLWEEWKMLLTGGSISAILVLYGSWSGKSLAHLAGLSFLGLTLLRAVFLSWRKQWREAAKNFVDISPASLIELREGKTSPLAKTLLRPYIGKRMKVTGTFYDVSDFLFWYKLVHLYSGGALIAAQVSHWSAKKYIPLPKGIVITLTGTIAAISDSAVSLSGIELVANSSDVVAVPSITQVTSA